MQAKWVVACYLVVQALGVGAWWWLLWRYPPSIQWFQPSELPPNALRSFWLPDFLCLVLGSLLAAFAVARQHAWAGTIVWAVAAAAGYASLYCMASSLRSDEAWIASAMMCSMAGMTLAMATIYGHAHQAPAAMRVTRMPKTQAIFWTFAQVAVFWSIFLWVLPKAIVECTHLLGWPLFQHAGQRPVAALLFGLASAAGLWSGTSMAIHGAGTPLPTATAPKLVVQGPYRFVRNPMALAGIVQGVAVGWFLGSFAVIGYAFCGALAWHCFVRPFEEKDLAERFGETYNLYRGEVRLWIPTLFPNK